MPIFGRVEAGRRAADLHYRCADRSDKPSHDTESSVDDRSVDDRSDHGGTVDSGRGAGFFRTDLGTDSRTSRGGDRRVDVAACHRCAAGCCRAGDDHDDQSAGADHHDTQTEGDDHYESRSIGVLRELRCRRSGTPVPR